MCSGTAKAAQLDEFKSPTYSVQGKQAYSPHLPTFGNGVTVISQFTLVSQFPHLSPFLQALRPVDEVQVHILQLQVR